MHTEMAKYRLVRVVLNRYLYYFHYGTPDRYSICIDTVITHPVVLDSMDVNHMLDRVRPCAHPCFAPLLTGIAAVASPSAKNLSCMSNFADELFTTTQLCHIFKRLII